MDLKFGLYQQQTLKLSMTQELKQAIELLQYSTQELTSFLEAKATENPLIQLENTNIKYIDIRNDGSKKSRSKVKERDDKQWIDQISQTSMSLQDYLFIQISLKTLSKDEKRMLTQLIYNLDANGYLTISLEEAARICGLTIEMADQCLKLIHNLEPAGVGARNLKECLLLQINRKADCPQIVKDIVVNYFNEFAEKKWKVISHELDVQMNEIQKAADYIKKLEPRPGSAYHKEQPQYIVPDLIVTIENDNIEVSLFQKHLPNVQFQKDYYTKMSAYKDQQVKHFLKEKTKDYQWIMKSLQQRNETLLKVGMAIIEKQFDFFLKGPAYLKPLTMKEVSQEIGIHESTVSRAVREKYIQTPFGTYELRYFFSAGLMKTTGEEEEQASAFQVKTMIANFIEKENKLKPLSDQLIVDKLKNHGIVVSRRTIAKYREQLKIPSSAKRKRYG
ncbi:RNA polymerase sigma-54 factor [Heyndrickxia sporothermodurans]|uniref:RNA polymerase factor sigma-54 n=1 Tax=Heyndrickxia sporothermodurans TaxID=46224 RepID=UPI000D3A5096|nr:RNA polymerase factor sigma-54 [Heyndrickxia sporothermodurans]PTY80800.1 RNA polymerase sigma-54 factor [Heyndrickxia sporothermodurans]